MAINESYAWDVTCDRCNGERSVGGISPSDSKSSALLKLYGSGWAIHRGEDNKPVILCYACALRDREERECDKRFIANHIGGSDAES